MNANKLFAFMAVAVMLIAPAACVFSADAQGESATDGELKEGMHIHLKNLDATDLISLFGYSTENASQAALIALAIFVPGLNTEALYPGSTITTMSVDISTLDVDISHYVSEDKTKMTLKASAKIDIKSISLTINTGDAKGKSVIIEPQKKTSEEIATSTPSIEDILPYLQQYAFKGDYAEKMRSELKDEKFGDTLSLDISGVVELYAESSFELVKASDGKLYFKNGGYLIPADLVSEGTGSIPLNKIEGKAELKATTKFGTHDVEIKDNIGLTIAMDYKRDYCGTEDSKITDGTIYRDMFSSDPKFVLEHSAYYNGSSNGTGLVIDLSNALAMLADGQYFKIDSSEAGLNSDYFTDAYILYPEMIGKDKTINYTLIIAAANTDDEAISLMKQFGDVDEGKEGKSSYSYDDANNASNDVRNSIEGVKATDNTMTIVGIVIAVIVILALVALWYFKFRPQSASASAAPAQPETKTEEPPQNGSQ